MRRGDSTGSWPTPAGGLVVLYGRRRCGKSTLLQRVLAAEHVYLQADQRESPLQLESLATVLSRRLPDFDRVRYRTWDELLASLYARANRRIPVCLDEFPYLAQADPALPSILQRYIDRPDGQIAWILCGSSQRMMGSMVMDRKAPLYGRAREIIKVEPLSAGWLKQALALASSEAVEAYATWGGVPRYWELARNTTVNSKRWKILSGTRMESCTKSRAGCCSMTCAARCNRIRSSRSSAPGAIVLRRLRPEWPHPCPAWHGLCHCCVN